MFDNIQKGDWIQVDENCPLKNLRGKQGRIISVSHDRAFVAIFLLDRWRIFLVYDHEITKVKEGKNNGSVESELDPPKNQKKQTK